jgi:hypothetical protein
MSATIAKLHAALRSRAAAGSLEEIYGSLPPRARAAQPRRPRKLPGPLLALDLVLRVPGDDGVRVVRNVAIDMPLVSIQAQREHWANRQRRRAKVHRVIHEALGSEWMPPTLPAGWRWLVTFTRFGALLMDDDNLVSAFKEHRDCVADILGLKDNDPRVSFRCVGVQKRVRGEVRRFNRKTRRYEMCPGFKSWFRVRVEMVRVESRPIRWALTQRFKLEKRGAVADATA